MGDGDGLTVTDGTTFGVCVAVGDRVAVTADVALFVGVLVILAVGVRVGVAVARAGFCGPVRTGKYTCGGGGAAEAALTISLAAQPNSKKVRLLKARIRYIRNMQHFPSNFVCYYGPARVQALTGYDWAILEPDHYTAEHLATLHDQDVTSLSYLTIGIDPGFGRAGDWCVRDPVSGLPVLNERWGGCVVDCRALSWQSHVLDDLAPKILSRGFQGFLLDNLDIPEAYADTRSGIIELVQRLRQAHPDVLLLANRGFTILDALAPLVDAVLFEAFTTYYDGARYAAWDDNALAWTAMQARRLAVLQPERSVLTLDYAAPGDAALRDRALRRAQSYGFVPFVSTWALDWLPGPEGDGP